MILTENDIYHGDLILVNKDHMYRREGETPFERAGNELLSQRAASALKALLKATDSEEDIIVVSGFRSYQEQRDLWESSLSENGREFTEQYVARPLHSEHQTGLAVDVGLNVEEIDFIRPYFPDEGKCRAFRLNAAKFGFILRYPAEKEYITHISHEPWHFRYVGVPHAEIMEQNGFTLEEYTVFLKAYSNTPLILGDFAVSYLKGERFPLEIPDGFSVSGNNADGFVLSRRTV